MLLVQWHAFNAVLLQSVSTAPGFQNTFLNIGSVVDHCSKISTSPFKKRFIASTPGCKCIGNDISNQEIDSSQSF